ncbi:hypothetical protein SK128_021686, partial [Halocaridina rubra]
KTSTSTVIHLITEPYNQVQSRRAHEERLASIAEFADVSRVKDIPAQEPSQKTTQSVLEAVEAVVASLSPATPDQTNPEQPGEQPVEANEAVETPANEAETPEEGVIKDILPEPSEAVDEAAPTDPPAEANTAEETPEETPTNEVVPTKKELKAIEKYNEATDQLLLILRDQLKNIGPIPLMLKEEALLALDETEPEPITEPESDDSTSNTDKSCKKKKRKQKKNKRRNKIQLLRGNKNNNSGEKGNTNNSAENNNNNNSGEKKKNKNKRNKNRKNNKNRKRDRIGNKRKPKRLNEDEEKVEGRRKQEKGQKNRKNNNNNNKKNKNRNNQNRKNPNKKNKERLDMESRVDLPLVPTADERAASNAKLTGINRLERVGDVTVDLSRRRDLVDAEFTIGPLEINLKDKSRTLTRAKVNTYLTAAAQFKVKSVRRQSKMNIAGLAVSNLLPHEVSVTRDDIDLDQELVTEAQNQVVQAIDIERIARILTAELKNILDRESIIENLDGHPFHKKVKTNTDMN